MLLSTIPKPPPADVYTFQTPEYPHAVVPVPVEEPPGQGLIELVELYDDVNAQGTRKSLSLSFM